MNKEEYHKYLQSDQWHATRRLAFAKHGTVCFCGKIAIDMHHLTYERVGNERLDDLLPLCRTCHDSYHFIEDRAKNCVPSPCEELVQKLTQERNKQLLELAGN